MERFISKENMQKSYGGIDTWSYEYIEPVPGENAKLDQTEERAALEEERDELAKDFVRETVEWARLDAKSDEAKAKSSQRNEVVKKLQSNYWKLDPYVRATTYLHRVGVVDEKGEVDFKGAKPIKA